jgi:hypothetical protein
VPAHHNKIQLPYEDFSRVRNLMQKLGKDFTSIELGRSSKIKTDRTVFAFAAGPTPKKVMRYISKVRGHVRENTEGIIIPEYQDHQIKYFIYNGGLNEILPKDDVTQVSNVVEIDINKAYWYAARNLGYITPDFFDEMLSLPKKHRLKILGSIATKRDFTIYESGKMMEKYPVIDHVNSRLAYNHIRKEIDELMCELARRLGHTFLFSWVDALFCCMSEGDARANFHLLKGTLDKFGYDVKIKPLDRIKLYNLDTHLFAEVYDIDGVRPFYLEKNFVTTFKNEVRHKLSR